MSRRGLEVWRIDGDPTPLARDTIYGSLCFSKSSYAVNIPQVGFVRFLCFINRFSLFTSHVSGGGNRIGPVCVSVYASVCVSLCLCLSFSSLTAKLWS